MGIDFEGTLKKCFTLWNRDGITWKYVVAIIGISIVFWVLTGLLLFITFGPTAGQVISNPAQLQNYSFIIGLIPTILTNLTSFILVFIPLILIISVALFYLTSLIHIRALQLNGLETQKFSFGKLVRFIGLFLSILVIMFTSLHDKRIIILFYAIYFLYIPTIIAFFISPILGILFFAIMLLISLANSILILIGLWKTNKKLLGLFAAMFVTLILAVLSLLISPLLYILFLLIYLLELAIYIVFVIYYLFRLSMSTSIFLHKDVPILEATKQSWKMTKGNVAVIFLLSIVIWFLILFAEILLQNVGGLLGGAFGLLLGTFYLKFVFAYLILFVAGPVLQVMGIHLLPAIYEQLLKKPARSDDPGEVTPERQHN